MRHIMKKIYSIDAVIDFDNTDIARRRLGRTAATILGCCRSPARLPRR
jgi:hypothetical protein